MRPDPKRAFAMAVPHISLLKTDKTRLGIDPGASPCMDGRPNLRTSAAAETVLRRYPFHKSLTQVSPKPQAA